MNAMMTLMGVPATRAFVLMAALGTTLLAGCVDLDDTHAGAPDAFISVDDRAYFAGDVVEFDVAGSEDGNGAIASYHIDFGDGETTEVAEGEIETVEHVYREPGQYRVVLTVQDDGAGQDTPLNDTDETHVNINDNISVTLPLLVAAPQDDVVPENATFLVPVGGNATGIEVDLTITGALVVGTSTANVRLLNETGAVVAEDNVSVEGGDSELVTLFEALSTVENHTLQVRADTGSFRGAGMILVYYGELPPTEPLDENDEGDHGNNTTLKRYA